MAESVRKRVYRPVADADLKPQAAEEADIREEQVTAGPTSEGAVEAAAPARGPTPYAEFGGLSQSVKDQRQEAQQRRSEAMQEWQRRLAEQEHARLALVNASKPEDATQERRKFRNLAIGQAIGEFVGALIGGIQGLGTRSGRGYVPKMPGMYRNTLERIRQLENQDILANQRFRGMMGSILERNAGDRTVLARERYRDAAAEEKRLRTEQDMLGREMVRAGNRMDAYEQQARVRENLQQKRHRQRLDEQRNAAALKGSGTGVDDEVAYLTKLLLPKTRTSTTSGRKFPTTTVRDATSYSKQEVAAATAQAKRIAPIIRRYDLSDKDVVYLNELTRKYSLKWDQIAALLENVSVEEISAYLSDNGME